MSRYPPTNEPGRSSEEVKYREASNLPAYVFGALFIAVVWNIPDIFEFIWSLITG